MRGGRTASAVLAALAAALTGGCAATERMAATINPDSLGDTDRCAVVMRLAMPSAEIEITGRATATPDINTVVATVEGRRTDLGGKTGVDPALAARCEFKGSILNSFRWTKGGP